MHCDELGNALPEHCDERGNTLPEHCDESTRQSAGEISFEEGEVERDYRLDGIRQQFRLILQTIT